MRVQNSHHSLATSLVHWLTGCPCPHLAHTVGQSQTFQCVSSPHEVHVGRPCGTGGGCGSVDTLNNGALSGWTRCPTSTGGVSPYLQASATDFAAKAACSAWYLAAFSSRALSDSACICVNFSSICMICFRCPEGRLPVAPDAGVGNRTFLGFLLVIDRSTFCMWATTSERVFLSTVNSVVMSLS